MQSWRFAAKRYGCHRRINDDGMIKLFEQNIHAPNRGETYLHAGAKAYLEVLMEDYGFDKVREKEECHQD